MLPLVHAFGTQRRHRQEFDGIGRRVVLASRHKAVTERLFTLVSGTLTATGLALVLFVGGRRVLDGEMPLGTLLAFAAYTRTLQIQVRSLLAVLAKYRATEASLDRVLDLLNTEIVVKEPLRPHPLPSPVAGHVRFESVHAGYVTGEPVLVDIDLDASPGSTIALVGRTGSGKSTLVSMIPRFMDPTDGRITLDGVDLRDVSLGELRRQIALVSQDAILLPISIAENIAYGRPDASRADIEAAAQAANAAEFIERLPEGYDTVLGERGATLSGGQRQRLSIARAVLKDAPVLVLDEPTSALDADTEHLVLAALDALVANRTTFVIAHRLSTIRNADCIVVIDHGRIAATGTHQQLMASSSLYAELHRLQVDHAMATG